MGALAGNREMRPFEVEAEEAGDVRRGGGDAGGNSFGGDRRSVGDERRQKRGGPELGMGRADRPDGIDGAGFVEERSAATIDLKVDEAGHDEAASEVGGVTGGSGEIVDPAVANDERRAVIAPAVAVEYSRSGEGRRHIVSVTLRRCGGRSGSNPRRRDSASTKA